LCILFFGFHSDYCILSPVFRCFTCATFILHSTWATMAEGASALSEGAFPMQGTSLSGAAERIAEAVWTGVSALTEEAAWIEGRHRVAATRKNAGSAMTAGDLRRIAGTC